MQKRALRIIFPVLHYQEALATTGCVSLHTKRMELCSKLFTKIKELKSRLRHLVPPTRSQAHGRSLRNKDRPSLISCKTERSNPNKGSKGTAGLYNFATAKPQSANEWTLSEARWAIENNGYSSSGENRINRVEWIYYSHTVWIKLSHWLVCHFSS